MSNAMETTSSVEEKVLKNIRDGKVRMRPRWYFVLRAALLGVGVTILLFALFFSVGFVLFFVRRTGLWQSLSFGPGGIRVFLNALPWVLIALSLLFLALLEVLVRRYSFAYRAPLAYSLLGIMVFVTFGTFVVSQTPLYNSLFIYSRVHRLPLVGRSSDDFYGNYNHLFRGHVTSFSRFTMTMELWPEGTPVTVVSDRSTGFAADFGGKPVLVFGDRKNGVIHAIGVRVMPEFGK